MRPVKISPAQRLKARIAAKVSKTWWQRAWGSRVAWGMAGAIFSFVLLHGVDALDTMQKLPGKASETGVKFNRWFYSDAKWAGEWSSRAEGSIEDLHLAEQPIILSLDVEQGHARGELYLSTVCDHAPQLLPVLVEGEVSAYGRLSAMAYAFVGGERRPILTFQAKLKDGILTVEAVSDPSKLLLGPARLASYDPDAAKNPDLKCKNDPFAAVRRAIEHVGKSQNTE